MTGVGLLARVTVAVPEPGAGAGWSPLLFFSLSGSEPGATSAGGSLAGKLAAESKSWPVGSSPPSPMIVFSPVSEKAIWPFLRPVRSIWRGTR